MNFNEWFEKFSVEDGDSFYYYSECRQAWDTCKIEILDIIYKYQNEYTNKEMIEEIKRNV